MKHSLIENFSDDWSSDSLRIIQTPSQVAKQTFFYVQEIGCFTTFPDYFTERQNLDSFLLLLTLSGKGTLHYLEQSWSLEKGDCFLIHCQDYHRYQTQEEQNWTFLWLHFNGNNAFSYYNCLFPKDWQPFKLTSTAIQQSLTELLTINQQKTRQAEILSSNLIHQLLTELLLKSSGSELTLKLPTTIQAICREIDRHFQEELTLTYFEKTYHSSRFHLLKEFKKYVGVTIHEYLILTRMSYAKQLLKNTDLSIDEVAEQSGMQNTSHFIYTFKKHENCTPLQFRKSWS